MVLPLRTSKLARARAASLNAELCQVLLPHKTHILLNLPFCLSFPSYTMDSSASILFSMETLFKKSTSEWKREREGCLRNSTTLSQRYPFVCLKRT